MGGITCQESDLPSEIIEREPSEETTVCERHGTPIQRDSVQVLEQTITIGPGCSRCEEEAAEKERVREQQRQETQFIRLQDEAGIPARYRTASLEPVPLQAPGQDSVLDHAKGFVQASGSGSTGLILLGKVGAGKTHTACAILNAFLRLGLSGRYFSTVQALRLIKETWRSQSEKTERQALRTLCSPHLLILDEVGIQHGTDSECLILNEVINDRYGRMAPTILVSNLTMKEFTQLLGERVVDRFREGGRVLVFDWPSLRQRKSTGT